MKVFRRGEYHAKVRILFYKNLNILHRQDIHNIVNKDLQQDIYNIKSNNGDWKLNHVKVSSTTDKNNQLLKESNSNFLGALLMIFSTLFQRS